MFRAMFSPIIRSTWLYSQYLEVFTQVAAGWCPEWVETERPNRLVDRMLAGEPASMHGSYGNSSDFYLEGPEFESRLSHRQPEKCSVVSRSLFKQVTG